MPEGSRFDKNDPREIDREMLSLLFLKERGVTLVGMITELYRRGWNLPVVRIAYRLEMLVESGILTKEPIFSEHYTTWRYRVKGA